MAIEKRLIDANALSCEIDCCSFETSYDCEKVLEIIAEAPTVDAAPVRHGHWKVTIYPWGSKAHIQCSECHMNDTIEEERREFSRVLPAYCKDCGARMDQEAEYGR